MKKLTILILLACAELSFPSVQPVRSSKLFILQKSETGEWCSYADEKQWQSGIDQFGALEAVSVTFRGDRPKTIKIAESDTPEAGDWMAYDTYELDNAGHVASVTRETRMLPGDVSRIEIFHAREGKLVRTGVSYTSLTNGHVIVPRGLWFPTRPLIARRDLFPFHVLLDQRPNDS